MSESVDNLKEALFYEPVGENRVQCHLCNWRCIIELGDLGRCGVRKNIYGKLYALNYDKLCVANPDPIEKKPLFHFQPGSKSFSIAAPGCNFQCKFCQNWQISQVVESGGRIEGQRLEPERIVEYATHNHCKSIAYTYTEPTIFMELANDCGKLAKEAGLTNVFVSNGFMTKEAIDVAARWLDGINVDLKSFSQDFYQNLCKAKLQPVLDTIEHIAKNTEIWMEVTTLIVPGENDSDDELKSMAEFIVEKAGADTPLHLSRFYPQYRYTETPATPAALLQRAYDIAKTAGLNYVYIGNYRTVTGENTYCPNCERLLIERDGFYLAGNNIENGQCPQCQTKIAGFEISTD